MKNFKFKIEGVDYEVSVNELEGNNAEVVVNGKSFNVELENEQPTAVAPVARVASAAAPVAGKKVASNIKSPLPGSIIKVLVTNGQAVKRGDVLLTMESMKMENNVCAEADGTVKNVLVKQGQNVMQDDVLIEFEGTAVAEAPAAPAPKPAATKPAPAAAPAKPAAGGATSVKAPLPGSIIKVLVSEGQAVKRGDVLLTMESMKMENNILAEKDGVVGKIYVQAGKSVMQDDALLDLA